MSFVMFSPFDLYLGSTFVRVELTGLLTISKPCSLPGPLCLCLAATESSAVSYLLSFLASRRGANCIRAMATSVHPSVQANPSIYSYCRLFATYFT